MPPTAVPILAYHQVRPQGRLTPEVFATQMRALRDGGWEPVFLDTVAAVLSGERPLDRRLVAVTFDDGYLDTWVHAFPVLQELQIKATVFVVTDRPRTGLRRPTAAEAATPPPCPAMAEACRATVRREEGSPLFASWDELAAMQDSGWVEVQSHGRTHAAVFSEPRVERLSGAPPPWWLGWATDGDEREAIPIYRWRSALAANRFRDDPRLREAARDRRAAGESPAGILAWLREELDRAPTGEGQETTAERKARVLQELTDSRRAIADHLGRRPRHFCYPWGHWDLPLVEAVREAGFVTACALERGGNAPGVPPLLLRRIDARPKGAAWLRQRLFYDSHRWLGTLYARLRRKKAEAAGG